MAAIQQMLIGLKPLAISSTKNLLISANTQNYVLNTAKVAGYVPGSANVVLTINSGIYVGSSSIATPSLIIDNSWAPGDVLTIVNNGNIYGAGGYNFFDWGTSWNNATSAASGGPAIQAQRVVVIQNNGVIGGGGGGGGGSTYSTSAKDPSPYAMAGGGGQGYTPGPAGYVYNNASWPVATGVGSAAGTTSAPGAGAAVGGYYAGSGGTLGASGQMGYALLFGTAQSASVISFPGAGGYCTTSGSNANITWTNTGTRLGTIG